MKNPLKDSLVPHEGNGHKPHLLRTKAVVLVAALVLFIEGLLLVQGFIIAPTSHLFAEIVPTVLVNETNTQRVDQFLPALQISPTLMAAAQMKANDMATYGYFAHTSPYDSAKTPWYWFTLAGYSYTAAGENLAVNFSNSQDVTNAWMNSPEHRANILDSNYTEIGIATAQGLYQGEEATFVVEDFGTPAIAAAPLVQQTPVTPIPSASVPPVATGSAVAGAATQVPSVVTPVPAETPATVPAQTTTSNVVTTQPSASSVKIAGAAIVTTPAATNAGGTQPLARPAPAPTPDITPSSPGVLGNVLASPAPYAEDFYVILAALVLIALMFKLSFNTRTQHPHLIANGIMILVIIGTAFVFNHYILVSHVRIF